MPPSSLRRPGHTRPTTPMLEGRWSGTRGRFLARGSNDEVLTLATAFTHEVSRGGKSVLLGFDDDRSHSCHAGADHRRQVPCDKGPVGETEPSVAFLGVLHMSFGDAVIQQAGGYPQNTLLAPLFRKSTWSAHTATGKRAFSPGIADPAAVSFRPLSACLRSQA